MLKNDENRLRNNPKLREERKKKAVLEDMSNAAWHRKLLAIVYGKRSKEKQTYYNN